jgi:hypothetical protein
MGISAPAPISGTTAADIAIIGAGPAGLIAAERLALAGLRVTVHERMPSPARKFLFAGRGGLNLTHGEGLAGGEDGALSRFIGRYGRASSALGPVIAGFPPAALGDWAAALGEPLFEGSSGRMFPRSFKATPLLRAWLRRLDDLGVRLVTRSRWTGFDDTLRPLFEGGDGPLLPPPDATLLALGGASWPRLGSDGAWTRILAARGIAIRPLQPVNCGVQIDWSPYFRDKFAGEPLKRIALGLQGQTLRGEALVTARGLEGGAVYALSGAIREHLALSGSVQLTLDLRPDLDHASLTQRLSAPRGSQSLATFLRKSAKLPPVAIALLREGGRSLPADPAALALLIKALPLRIDGIDGLDRAISTAGGIALSEIDDNFMLKALPSVFVAGEMLDWDAPTGGYLLQGSFSTGVAAAAGIQAWLAPDGTGKNETKTTSTNLPAPDQRIAS